MIFTLGVNAVMRGFDGRAYRRLCTPDRRHRPDAVARIGADARDPHALFVWAVVSVLVVVILQRTPLGRYI